MRISWAIFGLSALAGCMTDQEKQHEKMKTSLDPFVGQSIAAYVASKGPPQAVIDLGPNQKMFQWLFTGESPAFAIPINGIVIARGPQRLECRVSFQAVTDRPAPTLADWRISNYQWNGVC